MNRHTASFAISLLLLVVPTISRADNLFVSLARDNAIEEFDSSGATITFAVSGLSYPQGLAFDTMGNLYVANGTGGMIEKFDSSGLGTDFANVGSSSYLSGLAFDGSGNLYVASETYLDSTIVKFTLSAGVLSSNGNIFADLGNVGNPRGLAIDSTGNLYVACGSYSPNPNASFIEKITPSGISSVFARAGLLSGPVGLAFDSTGNLFVANEGGDNIEKFSASGGVLSSNGTFFVTKGVAGQLGVAFDSVDNLFVSTDYNQVVEMDSSGDRTFWGYTGQLPDYLAVQPIPEPSTYAMVTVGLIALASSRRRHSFLCLHKPPVVS